MWWIVFTVVAIVLVVAVYSVVEKRLFVNIFNRGNVIVSGMRGRGKDFAFCVVVNARKKNYISNVQYSDPKKKFKRFDFEPKVWELAGNTYTNLVDGTVRRYVYPYPDGLDYYISDAAIYFPAAYCNELTKKYKSAPIFQALSRHLGDANVHCNTQVQHMLWDKMRLQSDLYVVMTGCRHLFGKFFYLSARLYDNPDSADTQLKLPRFGLGKNASLAKANFMIAHGTIKQYRFICRLPYRYDSRRFKKILENDCVDYENEDIV